MKITTKKLKAVEDNPLKMPVKLKSFLLKFIFLYTAVLGTVVGKIALKCTRNPNSIVGSFSRHSFMNTGFQGNLRKIH